MSSKSGVIWALTVLVLLLPRNGQARVFDFNEKTLSTYLRGTFGLTNLQQYEYQPGFPSSVSFAGNTSQQFSGEFGFGYAASPSMTVRLGVELLYPLTPSGLAGNNSSGTQLLSLDSQLYSVIPQANIETFIKKWAGARLYLGGGVGYAVTTIKNTVSMTSAGNTALGVSDYIEEGTGWGIMGQGYIGYEFSFVDNMGLSFDLGYRYLTVSNYTANRNFTSPIGTFNTGNLLKNADGTNRYTDLSGIFAGLTFRIYIH